MKSFSEIIKDAGGPDGFIREGELEYGAMAEIRRLHDLLANSVNSDGMGIDDYNKYKRINLALKLEIGKMARQIRVLESEQAVRPLR